MAGRRGSRHWPALALVALVTACDRGSDDAATAPRTDTTTTGAQAPALSIRRALATKPTGPVYVRGYVVSARNSPIRLCERLGEASRRCSGASLRIEDIDLEHLPALRGAGGAAWTPRPVELSGLVRGRTLVIEEPHR